jgi:hypothetical protein
MNLAPPLRVAAAEAARLLLSFNLFNIVRNSLKSWSRKLNHGR